MRLRHVLRIAGWHLALYCFVILYILIGAYIFHYLEGEYENKRHVEHRRVIRVLKSELFEKILKSSNASFLIPKKINHVFRKPISRSAFEALWRISRNFIFPLKIISCSITTTTSQRGGHILLVFCLHLRFSQLSATVTWPPLLMSVKSSR